MAATLEGKLVVAISSRALFDFEEENAVFDQGEGPHRDRAYMQLQLERLEQPAKPGVAFSLVRKLLAFNQGNDTDASGQTVRPASQPVEVVILSRNDPVSGMRVFRSAKHYGLHIERGSFTRGQPPWRYLKPLHANLFLSAHLSDVRAALDAHPNEVRIAFDGDAVLFSDEAERIYQAQGLGAFHQHESEKATQPLLAGPFKPLLVALHRLQQESTPTMRVRTALVTARSAPAHERAIRTLMNWNIEIDEAMFLGGLAKGEFLREFEPDFFFDDQTGHIESAARHVPSGHVANGIANPSA